MGRTRRRRSRKHRCDRARPLDHQQSVINLRKFMSKNGFTDKIGLKLVDFAATGRGVSSRRRLHPRDVLITVPLELMITYVTLESTNFLQSFNSTRLTIHDLLTCFLVFEKEKPDSFWKDYVNSLPPEPPRLPALLSDSHIELLPVDLRLAAKKSRRLLHESWTRVQGSTDRVVDFHLFAWGFTLVNTRAVYVDPKVIRGLCRGVVVSDEPCMALCPFLDMFNHSDRAETTADLVRRDGKWEYQLATLTNFEKNEQVFISYGDHDNVKLFVEYGFFIPGNCNDCVLFASEEVVEVLDLKVSGFLYRFLSKRDLDKGLFFSNTGPSFNLKGFLYVCLNGDSLKRVSSVVYTNNYDSDFLKTLKKMCLTLLSWKSEDIQSDLSKVRGVDSEIVNFLECRLRFVEILLQMIINNKCVDFQHVQ